ncbi:MAG: bifunctional pyr operon transcriptional regulator/uracil phosphoribosyltransferase, partial [Chloroflexota bacterium]|nr:bifunctional pyr operon transcriptional regulator/uracil phosphoribosyltransferase [Chloroflexota bacterium]
MEKRIQNPVQIERALTRISHEILERNGGVANLVLVGMHSRGVPLAHRISSAIERFEGVKVPVGTLDIGMYRDDISE